MKMNIHDFVRDAGDKEFPPKPQYVRGGYIFSCPFCSKEISSHHFLNLSYWETACEEHLYEHLDRIGIKEKVVL
ncbi:hypothetical protein DRN50_07340 [Thermococci archaeon]|nr:MAG: hypothetical protein DRN50_07340 [Thermococci archaeon]